MAKAAATLKCPTCAHMFKVPPGADLLRLVCPHCKARIPEEALRPEDEVAEELAPGFRPGQRLGNYVIESLLGAGGMAVVFRGRQLSLNRHVAIKILPKEFAKNRLFVERFESEAAVLASLNHANIVSVIDRGREAETYFIVMEYVEGETLKDRISRHAKITPEETLRLADQTLAGLEYAHRRGVVHRDIKPGNIMINREAVVKVTDFGLAHLAKSEGGMDATRDNQAMGTLKYMAPEQLTSAKSVDGRADLYSFGVCLYEMLTGKLPLGMFKMPSELDPSLDLRWDDLILRALKMDPGDRFASAEEMQRIMRDMASTPGVTAKERQSQESTSAIERPTPSLTACANCGLDNPPNVVECRKCGKSLADLFDRCPACKRQNRIDVPRCVGCGEELTSHRDRLRREVEAIQAAAKQHIGERRYDAALAELEKLLKFRTREFAQIRANAASWIENVKQRRDRLLQRTYEAGQRAAAEGRFDEAEEIWAALPPGYQDVAERRKQIETDRVEAKAALAEGTRLHKAGDLAGAVAQWGKAAKFWPRDVDLRKRLSRAKLDLANLNLKRSYLRDSRDAATRGNVLEAIALCRKVLNMDPGDSSALLLLKELEAQTDELAAAPGAAEPEDVVITRPRIERPKEPFDWRKAILIAAGVAVLVVIAIVWFVVIPAARQRHVDEAARIFAETEKLRADGDFDEALRRCDMLGKRYGDTPSSAKAAALAEEMRKLRADAKALCESADALTGKTPGLPELAAAFDRFNQIAAAPPVTLVEAYLSYAKRRIEELRESIARALADRAAEHERKAEWFEALADLQTAAGKYAFKGEPVAARLAAVAKRVEEYRARLKAGREACSAARWNDAYKAALAALALIPSGPDAHALLGEIGPNLTPPEGMVFVRAGAYTLGGADGIPARKVLFPHGFFISRHEVTCAAYAEFLRAANPPPPAPPGWADATTPPAGAENLPVAGLTCAEAAAYAEWAKCALPTEDQWEAAARGADARPYPWGADWSPAYAVLGYGPGAVGVVAKDTSPCGARDMTGNLAEWTATPAEPAAKPAEGAPAPQRTAAFVVKGASWAGIEGDRPVTVVPGPKPESAPELLVLTPDPTGPELAMRFPASYQIGLAGVVEDKLNVFVRRWMPAWDQWAETRIQALDPDSPIARSATLSLREKGRARNVNVDFATGCVAVKGDTRTGLEARDMAGVTRQFPPMPGRIVRAPEVTEIKDVPPSELSLAKTASSSARMTGRAGARYLNVGFRCVRPLWTPPAQAPTPP
jgi:serine/threonine protein kinase/formylglycine-generating enzyme required for sulfatase activity